MRKMMTNREIYRHFLGNDLVTELLLYYSFFALFPPKMGCKPIQYKEVNQRVTSFFAFVVK
jgi:hypothetical protein